MIICRINLTTTDQLNTITKNIDNAMQRMILANLTLGNLNAKTITLKDTAQDLKQNSTKLQERNVEGRLIANVYIYTLFY